MEFEIYKHPEENIYDVALIKKFTWLAFYFSGLWFIYKKIYVFGIFILLIDVTITLIIPETIQPNMSTITSGLFLLLTIGYIGFKILLGFKAYEWKQKDLLGQGYEKIDVVGASSADQAIRRYKNENNIAD